MIESEAPGEFFQFSLWDSYINDIFVGYVSVIAFNSLYEIHVLVPGSVGVNENFQFSLWDSEKYYKAERTLNLSFQFSLWDSLIYKDVSANNGAITFQFSLWDSYHIGVF